MNAKPMQRLFSVALLLLVAFSCRNVVSENSVDPGSGTVDPTPYLGNWQLTSIAGTAPNQPLMLMVTEDSGVVSAMYTDGTSEATNLVEFSDVNGSIIASVQVDNGWNIGRISLQNGGDRMTIEPLDDTVIEADIGSAALAGTVDPIDDLSVIRLTATPLELRNYIASTPNLFQSDVFVFDRTP